MNDDEQIDKMLNDVSKQGKYDLGYVSYLVDDRLEFERKLSKMKVLDLVEITFNPHVMFLTRKGKNIVKEGGWLKHIQENEKKEKRAEDKDLYDYKLAKWQHDTFWWIFALAVFGGLYSIFDILRDIIEF